jgi:hypothetical protein
MFFIDLNTNIPYESAEQSLLTKDYPLLKRRFEQFFFLYKNFMFFIVFYFNLVFCNVFVVRQPLD